MKTLDNLDARPSEDRYKLLIEAVTDYAIYMLDKNGIVSSWNPGAQRFKGYTADEIIGRHFSQFYQEEDRAIGLPDHALNTAEREGKFEGEGWRVRKDGSRFWAHIVIDPIRDLKGELIGFAKITRDLTERLAAEEVLRRSEQQFRLLVQGVTDYAIYMLGPEGNVSSWNVGAQRIKQYTPDEIIGEHFSKFYTEKDRLKGDPQTALDTAAREGRFEKEGVRVRKDGTEFWAHVIIDAIRDERGVITGFAKVTRDITERRETQKQLDLAREALFQSQKMDAIGQLTGGIAHDFNNLLMAVQGSLELVRRRVPNDPKTLTLIDNAMQGAQRGSALTQRMLAFARRQDLTLRAVDIPDLVSGMTHLLQSSLGSAIGIETRFPANLAPVYADANQLEMALLNLSVNARDAMSYGGRIVFSANEESVSSGQIAKLKAGRYIVLTVADTGEGMDKATLTRAMEPFFTTKGVGRGTGLGLSMVHGMTEQSGGRFLLKSKPGEGTTAEIWLPVAKAKDIAASNAASAESEIIPQKKSFVVLAVDDDGLVLMNTRMMLEDMGHKVFEATSGKKALDILQSENDINLVITDHAMPQMTGVQLAQAVREQRPDVPIILATGYAELPAGSESDLPKLAKPFRQQDLAEALASVSARQIKSAQPLA